MKFSERVMQLQPTIVPHVLEGMRQKAMEGFGVAAAGLEGAKEAWESLLASDEGDVLNDLAQLTATSAAISTLLDQEEERRKEWEERLEKRVAALEGNR